MRCGNFINFASGFGAGCAFISEFYATRRSSNNKTVGSGTVPTNTEIRQLSAAQYIAATLYACPSAALHIVGLGDSTQARAYATAIHNRQHVTKSLAVPRFSRAKVGLFASLFFAVFLQILRIVPRETILVFPVKQREFVPFFVIALFVIAHAESGIVSAAHSPKQSDGGVLAFRFQGKQDPSLRSE